MQIINQDVGPLLYHLATLLFIYLAAVGLSCGMGIVVASLRTFCCGVWTLWLWLVGCGSVAYGISVP